MASKTYYDVIRPLALGYEPNDEVKAAAQTMQVVGVCGPSGVGKNTIMDATGLDIVHTCTTRPKRSANESTYRFIESDADFEELIHHLETGALLDAAIHPTTGEFYGADSLPSTTPISLFDITPVEYYRLAKQGLFGSLAVTYLTVPSYESWQQRLNNRGSMTPDDKAKRMAEAADSLEFALEDDSFYFILNDDRQVASDSLLRYAQSREKDGSAEALARKAGHLLLSGIKTNGQH